MSYEISLVTITKNSEETLGKTLESVKDLVDEIVLLDTGSSDSTLEIAKSYNANIFFEEWENDFSKAKNSAIDKAKGKWILLLDSDEYLKEDDLQKIKTAIKNDDVGIFLLTQKSYKQFSSPTYIKLQRLFRNLENIRFKYCLHEIIPETSLKDYKLTTDILDVEIEHFGYHSKELYKLKEKRNLNILKNLLLKQNLSNNDFFHYGVYFLRTNLNISKQNSIEKNIGLKLINLKNNLINNESFVINQDLFIFYSVIPEYLIKYLMFEDINLLFFEVEQIYNKSPYILYKYAEAFYKLGNYKKSIELLERCISFDLTNCNTEQLIDFGILDNLSYFALSKCYKNLGDIQSEEKYLKLVKETNNGVNF